MLTQSRQFSTRPSLSSTLKTSRDRNRPHRLPHPTVTDRGPSLGPSPTLGLQELEFSLGGARERASPLFCVRFVPDGEVPRGTSIVCRTCSRGATDDTANLLRRVETC